MRIIILPKHFCHESQFNSLCSDSWLSEYVFFFQTKPLFISTSGYHFTRWIISIRISSTLTFDFYLSFSISLLQLSLLVVHKKMAEKNLTPRSNFGEFLNDISADPQLKPILTEVGDVCSHWICRVACSNEFASVSFAITFLHILYPILIITLATPQFWAVQQVYCEWSSAAAVAVCAAATAGLLHALWHARPQWTNCSSNAGHNEQRLRAAYYAAGTLRIKGLRKVLHHGSLWVR